MTFCTDIDLLHWEPNILKDATFASQALLSGTGDLAGTAFTLSSGSLATAHITAGMAIVLSGGVAGTFPIVSVDSATQLTLSVLFDGLYPTAGDAEASPIATASGLDFIIRTFWPQRRVVSELLLQAAGLDPTGDAAETIVNPGALKRVCTLGTLHLIYSALAAVAEEPAHLNTRVDMYERLYRRALRSTTVELDSDGDGRADTARALNVLRLERV
jgi:hypothetical protein